MASLIPKPTWLKQLSSEFQRQNLNQVRSQINDLQVQVPDPYYLHWASKETLTAFEHLDNLIGLASERRVDEQYINNEASWLCLKLLDAHLCLNHLSRFLERNSLPIDYSKAVQTLTEAVDRLKVFLRPILPGAFQRGLREQSFEEVVTMTRANQKDIRVVGSAWLLGPDSQPLPIDINQILSEAFADLSEFEYCLVADFFNNSQLRGLQSVQLPIIIDWKPGEDQPKLMMDRLEAQISDVEQAENDGKIYLEIAGVTRVTRNIAENAQHAMNKVYKFFLDFFRYQVHPQLLDSCPEGYSFSMILNAKRESPGIWN